MRASLSAPRASYRIRSAVVTLALALFPAACARNSPPVDIAAEEAIVRQRALAWGAAEATNNVDSALSYMWEDAVMQPPNSPQIQGHAAARQLYESVRFVSLNVVGPLTVRVASSGDLAAVWGDMAYELELVGPGTTVVDSAKFVAVWEKRDGVWKALENTWNSNLAPAMP